MDKYVFTIVFDNGTLAHHTLHGTCPTPTEDDTLAFQEKDMWAIHKRWGQDFEPRHGRNAFEPSHSYHVYSTLLHEKALATKIKHKLKLHAPLHCHPTPGYVPTSAAVGDYAIDTDYEVCLNGDWHPDYKLTGWTRGGDGREYGIFTTRRMIPLKNLKLLVRRP